MKIYVGDGALYCEDCASPGDSGPHEGEEADYPQHCDDCGVFLDNPLTEEGERYVAESIEDWVLNGSGSGKVIREWLDAYPDVAMCDYLDYGDLFGAAVDWRTSPAPFRVIDATTAEVGGKEVPFVQKGLNCCFGMTNDEPCSDRGEASFMAPVHDLDTASVKWFPVCTTHAEGWWERQGVAGRMYRLLEVD